MVNLSEIKPAKQNVVRGSHTQITLPHESVTISVPPNITDETLTKTLSKPRMIGLLKSSMRKHLLIGFTLSALSGLSYKVFVADVRKEKYAEFYRTFNPEKEFEVMRKKGLFQSC